jgi:hypothetical protein
MINLEMIQLVTLNASDNLESLLEVLTLPKALDNADIKNYIRMIDYRQPTLSVLWQDVNVPKFQLHIFGHSNNDNHSGYESSDGNDGKGGSDTMDGKLH